jgi:P-type Cu+ transporter
MLDHEATDAARMTPHGPTPPPGSNVRCAGCSGPVDPLRASRVAIFRERFRYFCTPECRERYDPGTLRTPLPANRRSSDADPGGGPVAELESYARHRAATALQNVGSDSDSLELLPRRPETLEAAISETEADGFEAQPETLDSEASAAAARATDVIDPPDVGAVLLVLAMVAGGLSVLLALAGGSSVALTSRAVVATLACVALVAQYVMSPREPTQPHAFALLAAPVVATLVAVVARSLADPRTSSAIALAGIVTACTAAGIWLLARARQPIDRERERIALGLDQPCHRVVGDELAEARAADLRPGEEIVLMASEVAPVDATVTAGSAKVLPWFDAKTPVQRAEGDPIVAGASVVEGRLRAVAGWAGDDRAWMRLTNDPRRRADLIAPLARAGRLIAERGAPFAAGLAALTAFAANQDLLGIAMSATAAQAAIATAGIAQIAALHVARTVLAALERGIAFRTAEAFDRTGRVSIAAFCARGTLLLGEPEVTNVEPIGPHESERVLALVAGAESGAAHPVAAAVLRAARARGVRPDGVRSPNLQPGLGVTAVASNGQAVAVGNRALMLKEKISVAVAESKITDLEAMGRTVLLVALGGRLIGVVGLQDGLRPGARASVQHLLDVGVEPVLISGDARETCEALGRALDIEHIRPELLPAERGDEIRRLADGGAMVAVVGQSPIDDASLSASDVSVVLDIAGSSTAECSVQLASDDVRDAAWAIRLAHRCRDEARLGLTLAFAPAAAAVLAVAFSLAPPLVAPIASLGGTLVATLRLRGI